MLFVFYLAFVQGGIGQFGARFRGETSKIVSFSIHFKGLAAVRGRGGTQCAGFPYPVTRTSTSLPLLAKGLSLALVSVNARHDACKLDLDPYNTLLCMLANVYFNSIFI